MTGLIVVESPNKAKKIAKLYPNMMVKATVGHFRDLPVNEMGVEPPYHQPQYVVDPDKEKVLAAIRKAANSCDTIWIAADPDREGEAIAWHTQHCLGKKHENKCRRITFTEVNKRAIDKAMASPRQIDYPQVRAQEARRVVDRYVGYLVSPALKKKLVSSKTVVDGASISAGRVQSVAVKLLVELEHTIANFKPVEHFGVRADLEHGGVSFWADWDFRALPDCPKGDRLWKDRVTAQHVTDTTTVLTLIDSTNVTKNNKPLPPLTTSDLVKSANRLFRFSTKKAMDLAQKLFEVGLITYHRTDSPMMGEEFVSTLRRYATNNGFSTPDQPRAYRASGGAQEGHECCRVTDIENSQPHEISDEDQRKLYQMIWQRTLASQLADEMTMVSQLRFESSTRYQFVSKTSVQTSAGWRQLIPASKKVKDDEQASVPPINIGDQLPVTHAELQVKSTKPPTRLMERNLVSELEKRGIGRPSTYASIINTILNRTYAQYNAKGQVVPTALGFVICAALDKRFGFMDYEYTASIEALLDRIATGQQEYLPIVAGVYDQTHQELNWFGNADISLPQEHLAQAMALSEKSAKPSKSGSRKSPKSRAKKKIDAPPMGSPCSGEGCSGTRVERQFKGGNNDGKRYLGCTSFPDCRQFNWLD